jgi:hypothetical protein
LIGKNGGMNTQSNVFIITSTINTNLGLITPENRFYQTLETIESIRQKVNNSIIILVDNSSFSLLESSYKILSEKCDYFIDVGQRSICQEFNSQGIKGAGESYMLLVGLDIIQQQNIQCDKIFKISGRYKLSETFDVSVYDKNGKFYFKTRDKNQLGNYFLHSRMWAACGTIFFDAKKLVEKSFNTHLKENITIEEAIYKNIDLTKLIEFDTIHCEGYIAPWNTLIKD